jgi:2-deoxy-D-gluconate 3-dehydrogenase
MKASVSERLFSLAGKVAIVTGGSRGIGEMIARGFVESGVRTYITARNEEECAKTAGALSRYGNCIALPYDLSTVAGVDAFAADFGGRESLLHILVNNAGATWGAPLESYPEAGWDKVMDLNVKSVFFLTQSLLGKLKAAAAADDPARIVNIASINGITNPHADNYAYSASKAATIHLTRHLAASLANDRITVNCIAPGFFETKMTAHMSAETAGRWVPLGRTGNADDAAGATIFLTSRAGAWITGATVPLDGGIVASA